MNVKTFTYQGFDSELPTMQAFDAPSAVLAPVAAPAPRPMFTTEDMELAKTLAREEGAREAYEKAKKEFDDKQASAEAAEQQIIGQLLQNINIQMQVMIDEAKNSKQKFSDRLAQLALSIAEKVSGDVVADKTVEAGIAVIIKESIGKLDQDEKINIYLNAKNAAALNDKFTPHAVIVDENLQPGDFRVEWNNGYAERDVKKLWKSISEICSRHSSLEENETEEQKITNNETNTTTN